MSLSIEPTTSCNLKCLHCPVGQETITRKKGHLELELFKKIIDENHKWLSYLILYFQGEPLINPKIFDMIKIANSKNIYTSTSTNGHYLTDDICTEIIDSKLDKLIISIDGTDQTTYEKYRVGGELEKVVEGVKNITSHKIECNSKYPLIEIQFLVTKQNQEQISEMEALCNELNVDKLELKSLQVYNYKEGRELIPTIDKYSRYDINEYGDYTIKNSLKNKCWRMWSSSVITWDGKVLPCCFDKDAEHILGDLKNSSLVNVWRSKSNKAFRTKVMSSRKDIEICKNCTEGLKIKI